MEDFLSNPDLTNPLFYWHFLVNQFKVNDMFSGMFVLSSVGSMAYALRSVPGKIWAALRYQFTVELKIHNDDPLYESLKVYLSNTNYVKNRCRRLTLASTGNFSPVGALFPREEPSPQKKLPPFTLTPMDGAHLFFYRRQPILYKRTIEEDKNGPQRREYIVLCYLGRSRKLIRQLISDIETVTQTDKTTIRVFNGMRDYWYPAGEKLKRPLDTVFIPKEHKANIMADIEWFYANPEWYKARGIPYHRGYLFTGAPGTGKTSFIKAICSQLDKKLAICNLNGIENDKDLMELMGDAPGNSIIVLEDIDACIATENRQVLSSKKSKEDEKGGVTLSGVLNALDGVMTADNQIFIMTTNHPEKLDPALLRPGRVDVTLEFSDMGADMVRDMFAAYFPEHNKISKKVAAALTVDGPVSPAKIQSMFFEYAKNPKDFVKNILTQGNQP